MNLESSVGKRRSGRSSVLILIGIVVLAGAIYLIVPRVMVHIMVLDEQSKAELKYKESLKPNLSTEIEPRTPGKKIPMSSSAGASPTSASPAGSSSAGSSSAEASPSQSE